MEPALEPSIEKATSVIFPSKSSASTEIVTNMEFSISTPLAGLVILQVGALFAASSDLLQPFEKIIKKFKVTIGRNKRRLIFRMKLSFCCTLKLFFLSGFDMIKVNEIAGVVTSNFASSNFRKSDSSDFRKSKSPLFEKKPSDLEHVKLKTEGDEYKLKKSLYVVQSKRITGKRL